MRCQRSLPHFALGDYRCCSLPAAGDARANARRRDAPGEGVVRVIRVPLFQPVTVNPLDAKGRRRRQGALIGVGGAWPGACCQTGMSAIVYTVNRKGGDYIKATVVPANHSEQARFGAVDAVVVSFLLLCLGGLVCLLALT